MTKDAHPDALRQAVQRYYGETLEASGDLRTDACSTLAAPSRLVRQALGKVHPDIAARYYGCGLVIPPLLEGLNILDLGCGAGRDVYALSYLAGPQGGVTGIDMTAEQLSAARAAQAWHADAFGHPAPNTRFIEAYLEELGQLDLEPESFDVIVSNCVINLCADKPAVFEAAWRLLKPGGEMYFADVYADRRLPAALRDDPVLTGECLSGALYWNDFRAMARAAGFKDPRVVEHRPLALLDEGLKTRLAPARFVSVTVRLMKLEGLDDACEDYGQAVIYRGGAPDMETVFGLDWDHAFEKGRAAPVCSNTAAMLSQTRFAPFFDLVGQGETHFGPFPACAAPDMFAAAPDVPAPSAGSSCC